MPDQVAKRLAELPELSKAALCDLWRQVFNACPHPQLRRDLMIPILGYQIQEQAFGSLSATNRNRLRQLAKGFESDSSYTIPSGPSLKPGTRLVRQWRDHVHLVNVEANGYEYQGGLVELRQPDAIVAIRRAPDDHLGTTSAFQHAIPG